MGAIGESPLPAPPLPPGRLVPFSKSACELHYLHKEDESRTPSPTTSGPLTAQGVPRRRVPWYISVIHEKVRARGLAPGPDSPRRLSSQGLLAGTGRPQVGPQRTPTPLGLQRIRC